MNHRNTYSTAVFGWLPALFLLLVPGFLSASAPDSDERGLLPHNARLRHTIEAAFFIDGRPSREKITRYRSHINHRYRQLKKNLENQYVRLEKMKPTKARKKTGKKDDILSYKILLKYIQRMSEEPDPVLFRRLALRVLELDYALRVTGKKLASTMVFDKVPAVMQKWKIPVHRVREGEASNLFNPATGRFFTQGELKAFKRRGGDVSRLNPPPDSTYWAGHDVSKINVKDYYTNARDPLHQGIEVVFPREKAFFKKIRKTQTKPKMDLYFFHKGRELEFKLKVGAEVHSEITCGALYSAMGFSVDISKYVRDFKVVLGKTTPLEFRREWETYYGRYDLDKYIKEKGEDEEGHYLVFHEGVLEAKPDEVIRVGPWAYGENGHRGLREVRGSIIFNMWVANQDLKEAENNKLALRKMGEDYRFFHIQHDMGFAFGTMYIERPGSYYWNLVKKRTDKYVHFTYRCFQKNTGFDHVTYADARWMSRLIGRLTRRQITDAVDLGGWPVPLRQLLVEKLISRRNQLVRSFGLMGETTPEGGVLAEIPIDRKLTTGDGAVVNGNLKIYEFDGYPQYFGPRLNELVLLIIKGLRNMGVDSVTRLLGAVKHIRLEPEWFGIDEDLVSQVILRVDRVIEVNPHPRNESESFLVKDSVTLGGRLGYGYLVSGDVAYYKRYTMVYPVRTRDEGRFHNRFINDFFMPFKDRRRNLPKKHVMMTETFLEGRGKVRLRSHESWGEVTLTASKIYLTRRFLSRKDEDRLIFFEDHSRYGELGFRFFLEWADLFRFYLFNGYQQAGKLKRDYVEMDTSDIAADERKQAALDLLLHEGNPSLITKLGRRKVFTDKFMERKAFFTLFGFFTKRTVYRIDKIDAGDARYFQVESRKLKAWNFVDNGERHFSTVRFTGKRDEGNRISNPLLRVSLEVNDKSTFDGELKNNYLHFINSLAMKADFIDFNPGYHTVNGLWGPTQVNINMELYREAMDRLIAADEGDIWAALAEVSGKPVTFWKKKLKPRRHRGRPAPGSYSPARYLAAKTRYFIKYLREAKQTKKSLKRMRLMVKAVRKAIYLKGHMYDPLLLAVVHKLAGKENLYLDALITVPGNKENMFPARVSFYNESGRDRHVEPAEFQFIFDDPSEIYHLY